MYSNLSSANGNSAQLPPDPLYSPISSPYNVSTDLPLSPPPPPYTPYPNQDSYGLTNTTSISSPPAQVSYQNYSSNNPPFNGNNPLLQHPNLQNIPDPQLRSKKLGHVDYPPPSPPTERPLPPIPVNMESSHPPIPVNMAPPLSRSESTASTLRSDLFPRNTIFAQSNSRGTNETSSDIDRRCRICTNVFPVTEFSQITSHCRHGNDACSKCIRRHIRIELSKENENIRCLSLDGCRNVLQETDVQRLANEDDFKRYQQISIKSTLSQIPDFQWCINPECGSGQIHEAGDTAPIMTCESCSQKQCVIHKRPIPRGSQCDKCSRPSQSSTSSVTNHDDDYAIALCLSNWDDMENHSQSSNSTTSSTFRQNPGQSSFDTNTATTTNSNNNTSNSEPQDCIICADTITAGDMVRATSRCRHESEICRTCMARHIEVELSDKGNFKIRCPNADGCVEELEEADVRRLATGEAFERYQKLQINFSLSRIDEFKWCANPQCRSGQLHGSGEAQPIMTCNECGQKQCVIHDLPLRDENRCVECEKARRIAKVPQQEVDDLAIALTLQNLIDEERQAAKEAARLAREREAAAAEAARQAEAARIAEEDRRRRDETKSTGLISSVTKACPKCKTRIEKNGGCDHMTCKAPGCGYEFYWSNLRPYPR